MDGGVNTVQLWVSKSLVQSLYEQAWHEEDTPLLTGLFFLFFHQHTMLACMFFFLFVFCPFASYLQAAFFKIRN